jgi:hypothetical protein
MNIFYTQVDANLQKELNARAQSAFNRDTKSLNFMLSKFANVELSAYDGPGPAVDDSNQIHVLGGNKILGRQYQAGGTQGFLNENKSVEKPVDVEWNWNPKEKKVVPTLVTETVKNTALRIPPYISSADIQIGDNSMGLLNTANVVIEIPNAQRDLDIMEDIYMRPGRYVKLKFIHDASSLVSFSETQGLLSGSIPSDKKLLELYPDVNLEEKKTEIRRMNQITFEGLITNFDFSYQKDFSVQLQIQLRGTSNVFTDVSMFIDAQGNEQGKETENPIADPTKYAASINLSKTATTPDANAPERKSFYDQLFETVDADYKSSFARKNQKSDFEIVDPKFSEKKQQARSNRLDIKNGTKHTDQYFLCGNAWAQSVLSMDTQATFQRYITLGYLIEFINEYVIKGSLTDAVNNAKAGKIVKNAQIICSDKFCYSNYYPNLCSIDPVNILLLPADNRRGTTEAYATNLDVNAKTTDAKKIFYEETKSVDNTWQGFTGGLNEKQNKTYPSRIFINLELIQDILASAGNNAAFKISDFLSSISSYIFNATSEAISLKLITHPENQTVLAFYDEKFIGTPEDKLGVKEYTIPMTTSGSEGTIVHDFQLKASLPENVSSLSYVLNQDPSRISTEDIAPYINYMYNSNDPTKKTEAEKEYAKQHNLGLDALNAAKVKFSKSMTDKTLQDALDKAQKAYLQRPTPDIQTSIQNIAPIIPFDISFTIDGIHGFRYGDVLTFNVLPKKYRVNTVFSIVGVNHQVSQDSTWTTEIRCIMRPKVNG